MPRAPTPQAASQTLQSRRLPPAGSNPVAAGVQGIHAGIDLAVTRLGTSRSKADRAVLRYYWGKLDSQIIRVAPSPHGSASLQTVTVTCVINRLIPWPRGRKGFSEILQSGTGCEILG